MFEELIKELRFKTSRSSGPGGQHVNKVESRVELMFDVVNSNGVLDDHKELIFAKLSNRISNDGIMRLQCDETRSQAKTTESVIERFLQLVKEALKPEKKRKPTKPGTASREKRLRNKKKLSEKKVLRKPLSDQEE